MNVGERVAFPRMLADLAPKNALRTPRASRSASSRGSAQLRARSRAEDADAEDSAIEHVEGGGELAMGRHRYGGDVIRTARAASKTASISGIAEGPAK